MNARARWALVAAILLVAGVVALWPRGGDPSPAPAPDLTDARVKASLQPCDQSGVGLPTLRGVSAECLADGERVDVAAALGGKAVLVNVWATWCQPCREELPLLAEYAASQGDVAVVGLAVKSSAADALALLDHLNVPFTNLLDADGSVERALKIPPALPATYLIAKDGAVTFVAEPRVFRTLDDVRGAVDRYLGGSR